MRRHFVTSSVIVFGLALLASLAVHLPIYGVLGHLADVLLAEAAKERPPVEIEFTHASEADPSQDADSLAAEDPLDPPPDAPRAAQPPEPEPPKPEAPKPPEPARPKPKQPIDLKPKLAEERPTDVKPPPPPPPDTGKLAVTQRSEDPDVEPPPDAQFQAEENRRVDEETVASVRNLQRDDPEPNVAPPESSAAEAPGNAERDEAADLRDLKGDDSRMATPEEAERPPPTQPSRPSAGSPEVVAGARNPRAAGRSGAPGEAGKDAPEEMIEIRDALGTFRVPAGSARGGGGARGANDSAAAQRGAGKRATGKPSLDVSWSQFEQTFGADDLAQQREAYAAQRRSQIKGGGRQKRWNEFKAAIENYVPNVKPGNQTALNAAASPFAAYLAAVHRRIHHEYAHRFLPGLGHSGPFADESLHTKLEIVFNRNGSIHHIGVVKTSGFLAFDYGAFDAVMRGQPYPEPPAQILSGDGRVYVHWGFYRNHRQCGTFNAEPFILPNPPGTPDPKDAPFRDEPGRNAPGGVPRGGDLRHGHMVPRRLDVPPRSIEDMTAEPYAGR